MKIVVCGSYGDMKHFRKVLDEIQCKHQHATVFPDEAHLDHSKACIEAHHEGKGETRRTLTLRAVLMLRYFDEIDDADLVFVVNEKNGEEHYGVGTMIELGYAFAKGATIRFARKPTNANILSLLKL